ncbi:hypothetical protein [Variovorax sp. J22R115]|uniref:hypothetical protein n=1 Tax=Variovorax sp. J22R115 TaxID=3053509 RepID=UPI0025778FAB|nr:hypothetical protein [Variovorax sp. J22R115]MDM0053122.1 hypothetical protein [Variovorax sp. J22R115]
MTEETATPIQEATLWSDELWTARVIKNEDDDGWAVAMTRHGDPEPALVGPWTMGRDKKNPKPLDAPAFHTLVKTASEVLRRHEQQLHAQLNKHLSLGAGSERIRVSLQIVPDEDNPHAVLRAHDESGESLGEARVRPDFKLNTASAEAWIGGGFQNPR